MAGIVNGGPPVAKPPAVDPAHLPPSASSDIVLVPANPVEYAQTSRLNADEWRGPLTIEQYLERERHLLAQDLAKNGNATCWILTSDKLPRDGKGNRPILASCETLLVDGYVARNGKVDQVLVHGIGSVFTRKEHRGKGYAGRMMTELGKQLETWQQKNGDRGSWSVLYSDIGKNFYSRFGWKVFPSTHIHLAALDEQKYNSTKSSLPEVEDLKAHDLCAIPTAEYVETELKSLSQQRPKKPFVAVKPDHEHFAWHHAREDFVSQMLGRRIPEVKGAIHRATGIAIIWTRVYAANPGEWQIHVLHTITPPLMKYSAEGLKALSALLLRAQLEAYRWDMSAGVEVWDPSDLIVSAAQNLRTKEQGNIQVISRDQEHLCSLRWIGPDASVDDISWEYNQKYAWC